MKTFHTNETKIIALLEKNDSLLNALLLERIQKIADITEEDMKANPEAYNNGFVHPSLITKLIENIREVFKREENDDMIYLAAHIEDYDSQWEEVLDDPQVMIEEMDKFDLIRNPQKLFDYENPRLITLAEKNRYENHERYVLIGEQEILDKYINRESFHDFMCKVKAADIDVCLLNSLAGGENFIRINQEQYKELIDYIHSDNYWQSDYDYWTYSIVEVNAPHKTVYIAYPSSEGNESMEDLLAWESNDTANNELILANNSYHAEQIAKGFKGEEQNSLKAAIDNNGAFDNNTEI